MKEEIAKQLALGIACLCVRNTTLENLHAGSYPHSNSGDYSDVIVKTPNRNIPWQDISRISDEEMKTLMIEVVDRIYTVLMQLENPEFLHQFDKLTYDYTSMWNEPQLLENWLSKKTFKN